VAVTQLNQESKDEGKRQISALKFPYYNLADSVAVAQTIHARCGGAASLDELAAHLNYGGINNGAFKSRVAAARMFALIEKSGDKFAMTQTAQAILMPVYDWMPAEALTKAFLNVELFLRVYEEYRGKQLPPEFGLKNALKTIFGVNPTSVERAYRVLIESADTAGFFETRAGARTHLIIPTVKKTPGQALADRQEDERPVAVASGGGEGGGPPDTASAAWSASLVPIERLRESAAGNSLDVVKAHYIQTLVDAHSEKIKKGELDEALMTRIEKLLGLQSS
jgi:hypothetical protein